MEEGDAAGGRRLALRLRRARDAGWPLVWGLAGAQLVSWGILYYAFSLFVRPMQAELGWSVPTLNGALSLGLLIAGLCAFPVGRLIDRIGGRWLMSLGSALGALLMLAWSQVERVEFFYLIWAGIGLAMAATLYEPVFAVVTRRFPEDYRLRITAVTLVGGFASTAFIPLTQGLISWLGWREALQVLALLLAVFCLPVHGLWLRDGRASVGQLAPDPAVDRAALRRALRHPVFWALLISFAAYFATFSGLTFHLIPLLAERGTAMATVVAAFATIGPCQVLGRILVLAVARRASAAVVGSVVVAVFPLAIGLLIAGRSVEALFAFAACYGGANGIMTIVRGTAVPDLLGRAAYGAINGAIALPAAVAKALSPLALALVVASSGVYEEVLFVLLGLSFLSAVAFWFAAWCARREAAG